MQPVEQELVPCPFCNCTKLEVNCYNWFGVVKCLNCHARTMIQTALRHIMTKVEREKLFKKWNTRPTDKKQERINELESLLKTATDALTLIKISKHSAPPIVIWADCTLNKIQSLEPTIKG